MISVRWFRFADGALPGAPCQKIIRSAYGIHPVRELCNNVRLFGLFIISVVDAIKDYGEHPVSELCHSERLFGLFLRIILWKGVCRMGGLQEEKMYQQKEDSMALRSCPFCGGDPMIERRWYGRYRTRSITRVRCRQCGASTREYYGFAKYNSGEQAINAWNDIVSNDDIFDELVSKKDVIDLLKRLRRHGNMIPWEGKKVFEAIRKLPPAGSTIYYKNEDTKGQKEMLE